MAELEQDLDCGMCWYVMFLVFSLCDLKVVEKIYECII